MTNSLPNNYKLNARYTILYQIGQGGFGITYKAYDSVFDRDVCIKELFLSGNSRREKSLSITSQAIGSIDFSYFKNKFLEEAKKLAKFDHPNIVKVLEYFEANNTAYMVMDFIEGKNLKAYVQEKGKLDEETALGIFNQLLQATEVIHSKNYLHRDIKPDNIIITAENKAVLIDFGTAKFHEDDNGDTSTLILLSHGYAPPEQYSNQNKKDKYTDIYSLGATLYFMLTGKKPLQATDRTINELKPIPAINPNVSKQVESAVIKAMELIPSNRYQKVREMEKGLIIKKTKAPSPYTKRIDNIVKVFLITIAVVLAAGLWKNWLDSKPTTNTWNELSSEKEANKKSGTFTDSRDGKTYKWVEIGNQVWMAENLAYKPTSGKYWAYNNDFSNVSQYGYLYDWETACKVCPYGWHLPSDAEWTRLTDYLGGENVAGTKMKSSSGWRANGNGSNASGFSGLPGGFRHNNGSFFNIGSIGFSWSATECDTYNAWHRYLDYKNGNVNRNHNVKGSGFSVRCIKYLF